MPLAIARGASKSATYAGVITNTYFEIALRSAEATRLGERFDDSARYHTVVEHDDAVRLSLDLL